MPAILARLIVSIVFMLSTPMLYFLLAFFMFEGLDLHEDEIVFSTVTCIMLPIVIAGWIGLWRSEVKWTAQRRASTMALGLGVTLGAAFVGGIIMSMVRYGGVEVGLIFGGMVWALGWFGLTPLVWKETRAEREQRLRAAGTDDLPCPTCGYNLNGLREAKCPECGAQYTLDQLYASLREQAAPMERV